MKRLHCLQAPRLPFRAVGFRPDDRLPIRIEDQIAAARQFHSISARLIKIQKECLSDVVLVRPGFNGHARFDQKIGGAKDFFPAVGKVGKVMKAAPSAAMIPRNRNVVTLIRGAQPGTGFDPVIQNDLLRCAHPQHPVKEFTAGAYVGRKQIHVIETPRADSMQSPPLWLVLETGRRLWRRLEFFRLVINLKGMTIRTMESERGSVQKFIVAPNPLNAVALQMLNHILQDFVVSGPQRQMTQARGLGRCQLQRAAFVVSPSP